MLTPVSEDFIVWRGVEVEQLDYCPRKTMLTEEGELGAAVVVSMGGTGRRETADAVKRLGQEKRGRTLQK
jgi:hypothetical protein